MPIPFTRLCLNGGGIRGILQVGALQYLEHIDKRPLYEVFHEGMHGVSIGAVITSLLAFGFGTQEIVKALDSVCHLQAALSPIRLETLMRIPSQKGIDDGSQMKTTLVSIFKTRGYDLTRLKVGDAKCPLRIYASDLTRLKPVAFHSEILLWDALRASTSIPFVFTPHTIKGRVFVDGGLMVDTLMKLLPEHHRASSLHIYCSRPIGMTHPSEMAFSEFASYMLNANVTREHARLVREYPRNICAVQNNSIQALDFEKVKRHRPELLTYGFTSMQLLFQSQVPSSETSSTSGPPPDLHTHTTSSSSPV
jgi:predicted acylesterase/phospholipase RssA